MIKIFKLRTLPLIALISIVLISCKKNEKSLAFPIKLYGERIEIASATRLYTKNGEVKDAKKITAFVKNLVYFNAENDQTGAGSLTVTFLTKDKVVFGEANNDNYKFDVLKSDQQFLFTSEMLLNLGPINQNDFTTHIFKHQHAVKPDSFGNSQRKEIRVGYGNYEEMRFPMVAYATFSGNSMSFSKSSGLANNEFNQSALSYMKDTDTLAIKVYNVICRVK